MFISAKPPDNLSETIERQPPEIDICTIIAAKTCPDGKFVWISRETRKSRKAPQRRSGDAADANLAVGILPPLIEV
jgi:hypothetical protein